jgi:hypothetical protein
MDARRLCGKYPNTSRLKVPFQPYAISMLLRVRAGFSDGLAVPGVLKSLEEEPVQSVSQLSVGSELESLHWQLRKLRAIAVSIRVGYLA